MKSVLLIGLGRFGRHMAVKLNELHHEVMAVDKNEERVNEVLPLVTDAQIGDATNQAFLRSLGVDNYDVCFVTVGDVQRHRGDFVHQGNSAYIGVKALSALRIHFCAKLLVYLLLGYHLPNLGGCGEPKHSVHLT